MKSTSKFQILLVAFFAIAIVVAVAIFALARGGSSATRTQTVIWGTVDQATMDKLIEFVKQNEDEQLNVAYVQKRVSTFEQEFIEALASGKGPDAIILPQDLILRAKDKLLTFPYASYSERDFKDTFLEGGEIFLDKDGIVGFPIISDPLVLYWNRSLFSAAGVASPPANWETLISIVPRLTKVEPTNNVVQQSAVAFGEYQNVINAKEILSLLLLQAGTPIVDMEDGNLVSALSQRYIGQFLYPTEESLRFYTEFSNPLKPSYSWNRALQDSKKRFLSGDLAMYFGFASELADIRAKNPNLNFDVAMVPQSKTGNRTLTFGRLKALAIVRTTPSVQNTFANISSLISGAPIQKLSEITNLPPVLRSLLGQLPSDSYLSAFYKSALVSKAWLDPNPNKTNDLFQEMVGSVTSGRNSLSGAVDQANSDLEKLLQ